MAKDEAETIHLRALYMLRTTSIYLNRRAVNGSRHTCAMLHCITLHYIASCDDRTNAFPQSPTLTAVAAAAGSNGSSDVGISRVKYWCSQTLPASVLCRVLMMLCCAVLCCTSEPAFPTAVHVGWTVDRGASRSRKVGAGCIF